MQAISDLIENSDIQAYPTNRSVGDEICDVWDLRAENLSLSLTPCPKIVRVHHKQLTKIFVEKLVMEMNAGNLSMLKTPRIDCLVIEMDATVSKEGPHPNQERALERWKDDQQHHNRIIGQPDAPVDTANKVIYANIPDNSNKADPGDFAELIVKDLVLLNVQPQPIYVPEDAFFKHITVQKSLILSRIDIDCDLDRGRSAILPNVSRIFLISSRCYIKTLGYFPKLRELHILQRSSAPMLSSEPLLDVHIKRLVCYQVYGNSLSGFPIVEDFVCLQSTFADNGQNRVQNLATDYASVYDQVRQKRMLENVTLRNLSLKDTQIVQCGSIQTSLWNCTFTRNPVVNPQDVLSTAAGGSTAKAKVSLVCGRASPMVNNVIEQVNRGHLGLIEEQDLWEHNLWSRAKQVMEFVHSLRCTSS